MIYEIRTYRIAPGSLAEVEKRYGEAYEYRKKYSELTAFWHTEIGPLNEIVHVWGYKDLAELDFTHIIMGHGDVADRDWLRTFRAYVYDMVEAVRREVAAGATLEEVKQRVPATLAPTYEKAFSAYGDYRPWRTGVLGNIERTYAMVS